MVRLAFAVPITWPRIRRQMPFNDPGDLALDFRRRDARQRSRKLGVADQRWARHVVAPALRSLARVARPHPVSAVVEKFADEEGVPISLRIAPGDGLRSQPLLDRRPDIAIDDGRMQSLVDLSFMAEPADVDRVRQNPVEMATGEGAPARRPSAAADAHRSDRPFRVESSFEPNHAAELEIAPE